MKCTTANAVVIVALVLLTGGFAYHAESQDNPSPHSDSSQPTNKAEPEQKPGMMQCPMMTAMKGIELFADSPPVLLGQAQKLELTDKQALQIRAIDESARKQAWDVLNATQREQVAAASKGPLSMMELAKLQKKAAGDDEQSSAMCPMCMKMMRLKMNKKSSPKNDSVP